MVVLEHRESTSGTPIHEPAMVPQVLQTLDPRPGQRALDLTVGTGGHSLALARAVGRDGLLIGLDADPDAVRVAERRLTDAAPCPFRLILARFGRALEVTREVAPDGFDVVLADLGVGTHQLLDPERGLSFDSTERLDMRFDRTLGPSAYDVVNGAAEEQLADIFHNLGEERYSRQIAARICRRRAEGPIESAADLAEICKAVYARRGPRGRTWRIHPATRVLMSLRIFVNREMEELDALLEALPRLLARDGRAAVLTYHSLEARRVKQAWRRQQKAGLVRVMKPSPLKPTEQQVRENPKVRSAQLRGCRRL